MVPSPLWGEGELAPLPGGERVREMRRYLTESTLTPVLSLKGRGRKTHSSANDSIAKK
jgi:hypothetical protein